MFLVKHSSDLVVRNSFSCIYTQYCVYPCTVRTHNRIYRITNSEREGARDTNNSFITKIYTHELSVIDIE